MTNAYLNRVATAVPPHDVHQEFVDYAAEQLQNRRSRDLFLRMANRCQIAHRYSFLEPNESFTNETGFYPQGYFPATQKRMAFYKEHAFSLAQQALDKLKFDPSEITHLIITSCTGLYAPGLDIDIIKHYGLNAHVERTMIGFMGCYAAINALKMARHVVRSQQNAKVLVLNLELCTLHLRETQNIEEMLSFLIFADGCAAGIVTSEPIGIELQGFHSVLIPETPEQISWDIGNQGFEMVLSGQVPATIIGNLPLHLDVILQDRKKEQIQLWAIHPGGRSVLDAVQNTLDLSDEDVAVSRGVLHDFGNMSSATIMFVLERMLQQDKTGPGCGMAFGPGVMVETMQFEIGNR